MDLTQFADSADDYLSSANDLLGQAARTYQTVTGVTKKPQTAAEVANAAPVAKPLDWKPWAIGAGILAAIGGLIYFLTRGKGK